MLLTRSWDSLVSLRVPHPGSSCQLFLSPRMNILLLPTGTFLFADHPEPSSSLLWPERLPPYPDLRFPKSSPLAMIRGDGLSTPLGESWASCTLGYWCIPQSIIEAYSRAGVESLYPWQASCLHLAFPFASSLSPGSVEDGGGGEGFFSTVAGDGGQWTAPRQLSRSTGELSPREGSLTGQSLVYCAPTSGGKSLVADLIMIRRCLFAGKRCLYVVPHVSLCREKQQFLESLVSPTVGLRVQAFHSSAGRRVSSRQGFTVLSAFP